MKVSAQQLEKMIRETIGEMTNEDKLTNLKEARGTGSEVGTGVPDGEKIASFMKSFDKLIEDTILKTRELADQGEDLIQANLLNHPESGVRNEFLKHKVGMLRSMANNLATVFERVKRFSP